MKRRYFSILLSMLMIVATVNSVIPAAPADAELVLERLEIKPQNAAIPMGKTLQYTALGYSSDGPPVDVTSQVTWASENTTVAKIDSSGLATSNTTGNTTITATLQGFGSANTKLDVTPPVIESIEIVETEPSVIVGLTLQFHVNGIRSDGSVVDLTDSENAVWTSSTENASFFAESRGVIQGITRGTANVTVTYLEFRDTVLLTVNSLDGINVIPDTATIRNGKTLQYTAQALSSNGSMIDVTSLVTWTSGDESIATIDHNGLATAVEVGGPVGITASWDAINGTSQLSVTSNVLEKILLSSDNASIAKGFTQAYTVTGIYADGTQDTITDNLVWSSSNTRVAAVVDGIATGLNTGKAKITVKHANDEEARADLTVTKAVVLRVSIEPIEESTIIVGTAKDYVVTVETSDGSPVVKIQWMSSNEAVATIDKNGKVTGHSEGNTEIYAVVDEVFSNKAKLNVFEVNLTSIDIIPLNPTIVPGTNQPFRAIGNYSNGSKKDITTTAGITWVSANTTVAEINDKGLAKTKSSGSTDITAMLAEVTGTSKLTVSDEKLVSIEINPDSFSMDPGKYRQLTATGKYAVSPDRDITREVTWASSDSSVARIDAKGKVKSLTTGTTNITASYTLGDGTIVQDEITVTGNELALEKLIVTPDKADIAPVFGIMPTVQYKATGIYSDGHSEDLTSSVTWESSVPSIATISNTGQATPAGGTGTTVITATHAVSGKTDSTNLKVNPDKVAPVVNVAHPPDGLVTANTNLTVSGTVDDKNATVTVVVNKRAPVAAAVDGNGNFSQPVVLDIGNNTIVVYAKDDANNVGSSGKRDVLVNDKKPDITITSPIDGLVTRNSGITITGTATNVKNITIRVNGTAHGVKTNADSAFSMAITLTEGKNIITATAFASGHNNDEDYKGTTGTRTVTLDTTAPVITITEPSPDAVVGMPGIVISGTVDDPCVTSALLTLNGQPAVTIPVSNGVFTQNVTLVPGDNNYIIEATDGIGNSGDSGLLHVILDDSKPFVQIAAPVNKLVTNVSIQTVNGTIDNPAITSAILILNGVERTISVVPSADNSTGVFSEIMTLINGINTIEVTVVDDATPPNEGTSGVLTVTLDVTAPNLTTGLSEPADSISIMVSSDEALKQIPVVSISGVTLDGSVIGPVAVTMTMTGIDNWVGTYGSDVEKIANGDYVVTFTGEDKAGNKTIKTATFSKKSVTTDGVNAAVVEDAGTRLEIETNGAITSDITVTQHLENPSGNVGKPSDADNPAVFVEINASAELRNELKQIYIEVSYNPDELPEGTVESTLKLYLWDVSEGIWKIVPNSGVNTVEKFIFGTINHLSKYGAFGSIASNPSAPVTAPYAPPTDESEVDTTITVTVEGLTASVPLKIDNSGIVEAVTQLTTADEKAVLVIDSGTKVLDREGEPVAALTSNALAEPPAPPAGAVIAVAYDFGPDGTTFEPAITLVFPYDPADLPEGTDESSLTITWWNGSEWVSLETAVDMVNKTVSAAVSHFTNFALVVPPAPVEAEPVMVIVEEPVAEEKPVMEETPVIEEKEVVVEASNPVVTRTAGIGWWIWMILVLAIIGSVTAAYVFFWKPKTMVNDK